MTTEDANKRSPIVAGILAFIPLVAFFILGTLLWISALPTLAWLGDKLSFPLFIIQNWDDLAPHTKTLVIVIVVGFILSVSLILKTFHFFVWRSWFPDFYREDEHGHRTRYGRVYLVKRVGDQFLTYWRWNGGRSAPWHFHHILTDAPPTKAGMFRLVIRASRFEQTNLTLREWAAIPTSNVVPTTRVKMADFRAWEIEDLERKKDIARDGAEGHLSTQRQKLLLNRRDPTIIRGGMLRKRKAEHTRKMAPIKKDVLSLVPEGPNGLTGDESAPSYVDDGAGIEGV